MDSVPMLGRNLSSTKPSQPTLTLTSSVSLSSGLNTISASSIPASSYSVASLTALASGTPHGQKQFHERSLEMVLQQNHLLAGRLLQMEKENRDLKRSIANLASYLQQLEDPEKLAVSPFSIQLQSRLPHSQSVDSLNTTLQSQALPQSPPDAIDGIKRQRSESITSVISTPISAFRLNSVSSYRYALKSSWTTHSAAIYSLKYSHSGKLIASGSLDKSVHIISEPSSVDSSTNGKIEFSPKLVLSKHHLQVTDLSWSSDDSSILTSSFDGRIRLWDVASMSTKPSVTFPLSEGNVDPVLCCLYLSEFKSEESSLSKVLCAASSSGFLMTFDARVSDSAPSIKFSNGHRNGKINSLFGWNHGYSIGSADSEGNLKLWDLRKASTTASPISVLNVSEGNTGLCHVAISNHFVAVDSFGEGLFLYKSSEIRHDLKDLELVDILRYREVRGLPVKSSILEKSSSNVMLFLGTTNSFQGLCALDMTLGDSEKQSCVEYVSVPKFSGRVYCTDVNEKDSSIALAGSNFSVQILKPIPNQSEN